MRRAPLTVLAAAVVTLSAGAAAAQPMAALRPGHVVFGLGGGWVGADTLGTVRAATRASAPGTTSPPPALLFDTSSRLGAAPAAEASVTIAITPAWAVEVRGTIGRPTLTTTITNDVEATGTFTATTEVAEYVVDASVLYHPRWAAIGRRVRGYFVAGGGYLRQLYDRDALVETGTTAHAGAGARWWLVGGHGRGVEAGFTGDVRWLLRRDGIAFEDGVRSLPAAGVRAFVGF
jgi:hypothetical protein